VCGGAHLLSQLLRGLRQEDYLTPEFETILGNNSKKKYKTKLKNGYTINW
jgi:hypothetical protein